MGRAEVDVWLLPRPTVLPPLAWLDDAERTRAATLPPGRAAEFVAGRRLLRAVLGQRLGLPPDQVPLVARCPRCGDPHGQVRVLAGAPWHVSVSRSGPLVAVATAELPVGVDVESVAAVGAAPVADVVLSAAERERHSRLRAGERPADLARTWARKEAVLKALGAGLELAPSSFTLTVPVTTVGAPLDAPAVGASDGGVAVAVADLGDGEVGAVGAVAVVGVAGLAVRVHDGAAVLAGAGSGPAGSGEDVRPWS
ncbi:4'-phosphopantetheinyl transferase family protein [Georgenia daeguensis]|uniref:4'-phosphopantetheinyl transferase domain-containing protein n=1 Tax=Georgenia daeguensis TaxID=908355 RepID=A0ABP8EPS5_9MICO